MQLFSKYTLGEITLKNRVVMAPMTRSRAINNVPNQLMATYYGQRAKAGLIITEGVAPSPNGLGYARIPGLYSDEQVEAWKNVTRVVHANGGKIFAQIMHTGRVSHLYNMPEGAEVVAPSAIQLSGEMYTDKDGPQAYPVPREMDKKDIHQAIQDYVSAAKNAIKAGFDGVEIHGANGYLVDQFINTASNKRQDEYGGTYKNRARFALEVTKQVTEAIGAHKTGIRISPNGVFSDMAILEDVNEIYEHLATEFGKLNLAYIHIVDHSSMGAPEVPQELKDKIGTAFGGTIIASGGLNKELAEDILSKKQAELTAFGRPFISNPDLVYRMEHNLAIAEPDFDTFYTPGDKGYTNYPTFD